MILSTTLEHSVISWLSPRAPIKQPTLDLVAGGGGGGVGCGNAAAEVLGSLPESARANASSRVVAPTAAACASAAAAAAVADADDEFADDAPEIEEDIREYVTAVSVFSNAV